jgi:hypothetical protein
VAKRMTILLENIMKCECKDCGFNGEKDVEREFGFPRKFEMEGWQTRSLSLGTRASGVQDKQKRVSFHSS